MTPHSTASVLDDVFDLDARTTDLSLLNPSLADSEPCTGDNCGQSPTTGHTTGCATPDGPIVPGLGCSAL
ncbi:hypothetical protein PJ985_01135 [Streptomyces sp. ACA25]|uniref:hypothetical protein n=1 Tax=Streptomyces sp. ACA25 TaxID=3022596 RepID=UPI0023075C12|nr:hypothetical protein [Streptomyces sp. ACA25]MDB1086178.1 hypothetical protein [Streptomyces sp. ACA25]